MKQNIIEGIDYYYNEEGYMVLTEQYHLDRGYCCGNGCMHCPFEYEAVPEPKKSELILKSQRAESKSQMDKFQIPKP